MEQVADRIHALGSRGHRFYAVVDGDEVTVIDAGCSGEWRKLAAGMASLGLSIEAISGVLITHTHPDHFGLAARARDHGISVAVHDDERDRAAGTYRGRYSVTPRELPFFRLSTMRTFLPMARAGALTLRHTDDVDTFYDGHRFDLPGRPIGLHVPGHTEGHAMYGCDDLGVLFTGDGLVTMDLIGPARGPQVLGPLFNHDQAQTIASLDRIVEVDADLILPGHGSPWRGSPAEAVSMARG